MIEDIVKIFKEIGVWNNGKFLRAVEEYCAKEGLDCDEINSRLETAFYDYMATNITSENAIRFRLKDVNSTINDEKAKS